MRRKRRSRGVWLPVRGTTPTEGIETSELFYDISIPADGEPRVGILPITWDKPREDDDFTQQNTSSLADILGSEYVLRRIVGKAHIGYSTAKPVSSTVYGETPTALLVGLGFFVARAGDNNSAEGEDQPIGNINDQTENYNPISQHCIREPWIWRRTWILSNPGKRAYAEEQAGGFSMTGDMFYPATTAGYGSVADGPHIDAKTVRRVGQDDRLWMATAVRTVPFHTAADFGGELRCNLDLRLFGSLRKARGSGKF